METLQTTTQILIFLLIILGTIAIMFMIRDEDMGILPQEDEDDLEK